MTRTGATILFYEYFHGDNGAGLGASHQTGWTGASPACSTSSAASTHADVLVLPKERLARASSASRCREQRG